VRSFVKPPYNFIFIFLCIAIVFGGLRLAPRLFRSPPPRTPTVSETCKDTTLLVTDEEVKTIQNQILPALTTKNTEQLISLSDPELTVDCTTPDSVDPRYERIAIPEICANHATETAVKLYTLGYEHDGLVDTKEMIGSKLLEFLNQYGVPESAPHISTYACSKSLVFTNKTNDSAIVVGMSKRRNGNDIERMIQPTLFSP
jgi:hypothetical protein